MDPTQSADAPDSGADDLTGLDAEVVRICRELIQIDTSNYGGRPDAANERPAADYVMGLLQEVGYEPQLLESAPGRASVILRIEGQNRDLPALVVHGHLDVVPAEAKDWSVDPFGAEMRDGMIWGRGAVDMKDMDAMILTTVRDLARTGTKPQRDLVIAFFADEEAGGVYGAQWIVEHHPELFDGATEAISEVGGFSTDISGTRTYLIQTAEKGLAWTKLTAHGTAGHGSGINPDNAVTNLAAAVTRIGQHEWGRSYRDSTRALFEGIARISGTDFDPGDPEPQLKSLGHTAKWVRSSLSGSINPTVLQAGYKDNVIPSAAEARIDIRTLPGEHEETLAKVRELAGDKVEVDFTHQLISLEAPSDTPLVHTMGRLLDEEDPGCEVLPYMLAAGTDNKAMYTLGIQGYGFVPLRLPEELDFTGLFHGVDERVPIDALLFGRKVLARLMAEY
jgi:acetylornithine deacetylase/succinyl-diaminopimelate desuccinylase-like protein